MAGTSPAMTSYVLAIVVIQIAGSKMMRGLNRVAIVLAVLALAAFSASPSLAQHRTQKSNASSGRYVSWQQRMRDMVWKRYHVRVRTITPAQVAEIDERQRRLCLEDPAN